LPHLPSHCPSCPPAPSVLALPSRPLFSAVVLTLVVDLQLPWTPAKFPLPIPSLSSSTPPTVPPDPPSSLLLHKPPSRPWHPSHHAAQPLALPLAAFAITRCSPGPSATPPGSPLLPSPLDHPQAPTLLAGNFVPLCPLVCSFFLAQHPGYFAFSGPFPFLPPPVSPAPAPLPCTLSSCLPLAFLPSGPLPPLLPGPVLPLAAFWSSPGLHQLLTGPCWSLPSPCRSLLVLAGCSPVPTGHSPVLAGHTRSQPTAPSLSCPPPNPCWPLAFVLSPLAPLLLPPAPLPFSPTAPLPPDRPPVLGLPLLPPPPHSWQ